MQQKITVKSADGAQGTVTVHGIDNDFQVDEIQSQLGVDEMNLAQLESRKAALEKRVSLATTDKERDAATSELKSVAQEVAEKRASVEKLKSLIAEEAGRANRAVATFEPPAATIVYQDKTMFGMSEEEFFGGFSALVLLPLVALIVRRYWTRPSAKQNAPLSHERLVRLEQAVEAVAIEVERIGESQRYQAKLMTDKPKKPDYRVPGVRTPV